jgi:hypothetical protein
MIFPTTLSSNIGPVVTEKKIKMHCYIDKCDLWGFIREINSCISHARYQFFFWPNYFYTTIRCGGYVPCCVTVKTHTIVN